VIQANRQASNIERGLRKQTLTHYAPFEYSECTAASEKLGMRSPAEKVPTPPLDRRDVAALAADEECLGIVYTMFKWAMDGDLQAAEMLVLHTHGLDGSYLESYGEWVGQLWLANPGVLEHVASRWTKGMEIIVGEIFASILNEYPSFAFACATINQHQSVAPQLARALRARLNTEAPQSWRCSTSGTEKSDEHQAVPTGPGGQP
jgi:hypothetical protein